MNETDDIRETRSAAVPQEELQARGLPALCFTYHPLSGEIVTLRRGHMGYFPTMLVGDPPFVVTAQLLNESINVTKAQHAAMLFGSMFGFHCAGADPSVQAEFLQEKPR
jgi:hypothetical protein